MWELSWSNYYFFNYIRFSSVNIWNLTGGPWRFFCCKIGPGVWDMSQWSLVTPEAGEGGSQIKQFRFLDFLDFKVDRLQDMFVDTCHMPLLLKHKS